MNERTLWNLLFLYIILKIKFSLFTYVTMVKNYQKINIYQLEDKKKIFSKEYRLNGTCNKI